MGNWKGAASTKTYFIVSYAASVVRCTPRKSTPLILELSSFELDTQLHKWEDLTPHDVLSADGRDEIILNNGRFIFANDFGRDGNNRCFDVSHSEVFFGESYTRHGDDAKFKFKKLLSIIINLIKQPKCIKCFPHKLEKKTPDDFLDALAMKPKRSSCTVNGTGPGTMRRSW